MLVPEHVVKPWFDTNSWMYKRFAYIFNNPLWQRPVPKGFSVCPYFWMALLLGAFLMPGIVVPLGRVLKFSVRILGYATIGPFKLLDNWIARMLWLRRADPGMGLVLVILFAAILTLLGIIIRWFVVSAIPWLIHGWPYVSFSLKCWIGYAVAGLYILIANNWYAHKYGDEYKVYVYYYLWLIIAACAAIAIWYMPIGHAFYSVGWGLWIALCWLAKWLLVGLKWLGYLVVGMIALALAVTALAAVGAGISAGMLWLVGCILNRTAVTVETPGTLLDDAAVVITRSTWLQESIVRMLSRGLLIPYYRDEFRSAVKHTMTSLLDTDLRRQWMRYDEVDGWVDVWVDAVIKDMFEYLVPVNVRKAISALPITKLGSMQGLLMRTTFYWSSDDTDMYKTFSPYLSSEQYIELHVLAGRLRDWALSDPEQDVSNTPPVVTSYLVSRREELERYLDDFDARHTRDMERAKQQAVKRNANLALCKKVTTAISSALCAVWRGIRTVGKFLFQVLCWLWIVLKSKKQKWCPYFMFENK